MTQPDYRLIPIDMLRLDPENPRFVTDADTSDLATFLEWFNKDADLLSVADSIATNGYFAGEPLLVAPDKRDSSHYVVVEGNRRFAAVLLLHNPDHVSRAGQLREMSARADLDELGSLPCAVYGERREILNYLGNRHIAGVRPWEPLAKASYLRQLRKDAAERGDPTDDRALARSIGSKADYVRRLLNSLEAFERVESRGVATRDEAPFSILQTALQYTPIQRWVGIDLKTEPKPGSIDDAALDQLAGWTLVPVASESGPPAPRVNSRQLKQLSAIVDSDRARNKFANGASLEEALRFTEETSEALFEAIVEARNRVVEARSHAARLDGAPEGRHLDAIDQLEGVVGELAGHLRGTGDSTS